MPTPNYIVGKCVAVLVGGSQLYAKSGNTERKVNVVRTTNSRDQGYQSLKAGIKSATASITCVYNGDSPPTLTEGTEVTLIVDTVGYMEVDHFENPTDNPTGTVLTMQALVTSIKDTWNVEDDYTWSFDCESTTPYTVATATGATPST